MAAETDNSTSRFELDGVQYEVPDFLDLEIGDWELVYDESKVVLSDFAPIVANPKAGVSEEDASKLEAARLDRMRNPRVEKSFLMVAYLRAHPEATRDEAREVTTRARLVPLLEQLNQNGDGDEVDPTLTTGPEPSSKRSSVASIESSSQASKPSLETPEGQRDATGTDG